MLKIEAQRIVSFYLQSSHSTLKILCRSLTYFYKQLTNDNSLAKEFLRCSIGCYRKLEIRAHTPLKLEEVLKVLEMAECRNLGSLNRQGLSGVCAFKSCGKQRWMPAGAPGGGELDTGRG